MIPTMTCVENACFLGLVWVPDVWAEFLAWWMPFNLLSWLAMLITVPLVTGLGWKEDALTLRHILLMTVIFWPDLIGRVGYVLITHHSSMRKRKAHVNQALRDF